MIIEDTFEFQTAVKISRLESKVEDLQKQIDNLCNDDKVLSAVAEKLIDSGILK